MVVREDSCRYINDTVSEHGTAKLVARIIGGPPDAYARNPGDKNILLQGAVQEIDSSLDRVPYRPSSRRQGERQAHRCAVGRGIRPRGDERTPRQEPTTGCEAIRLPYRTLADS